MALTERQQAFYTDLVDLWRLSDLEVDANKALKQPEYYLVEENVSCRWETTQFRNTDRDPIGRTQDDNFFTEDEFHFELTQVVKDTDILVIKSDHPQALNGYKVVGFGAQRIGNPESGRAPNYTHVRSRLTMPLPQEIQDWYSA